MPQTDLPAKTYFSRLPQKHDILWNDGPRLKAIHKQAGRCGPRAGRTGQGPQCLVLHRLCAGLAKRRCGGAARLRHHNLFTGNAGAAGLPGRQSGFPYQFCKGYYPRIAEGKLNGRVSRLLVSPLLSVDPEGLRPSGLHRISQGVPLSACRRVRHARQHASRHAHPVRLGSGDRRPFRSLAQSVQPLGLPGRYFRRL
jgi:hypothetical protein